MKEQLEKIKAELRALLELEAKATPGPWKHNSILGGWDGVGSDFGQVFTVSLNHPINATFAVRSRNITKPMAQGMLDEIEWLEAGADSGNDNYGMFLCRLQSICDTWNAK